MTGASYPPESQSGGPPTPVSAPPAPARPGHVTAAAIIHIAAGVLTILFGLIFLLAGTLIGGAIDQLAPEAGGLGGAFAGIFVVVAVVVLGIGGLILITGIKVLHGRPWARITGIVIAVIGALLSLAGLTGEDANVVFSLAFVVAWAYAAWALFAHRAWFAPGTRPPA